VIKKEKTRLLQTALFCQRRRTAFVGRTLASNKKAAACALPLHVHPLASECSSYSLFFPWEDRPPVFASLEVIMSDGYFDGGLDLIQSLKLLQ
jgi:hypothetical protein